MNHVTYRRLLAGSFMALSAFSTPGYAQQTLPSMTVEAEKEERGNAPSVLNGTILAPREESAFKAYDGGDYLSLLPGVSAGRMGGHGVEPVIRGQQQTQLNIIQDGAVIHGGCPNRMDPPASFAEPETYDSITVLRGYQSVQYGSGGSGGTVIFERDPVPYEGSTVQSLVDLRAGYETNGSIKAFSADASIGNSLAQIRAIGSFTDAGNYKDGGGQTVRSAFESRSLSLLPVWMPTKETQVSLGLELKETDDALYAGAGMDAPEDENQTIRFSVAHDMDEGQSLKRISFQAYGSFVDHVMDNYSLRPNTGMKMKTESESDTFGGMLSGDFVFGAMPVTAGVDVQHNSRDAKRTSGMLMVTSATTPQSYMWPDVTLQQIGVFVEAEPQVTERSMLRAGMRYDHVKARADAADQVYGMTSPNALYTTYYGGVRHHRQNITWED